jgi:transcriptional regulator with XRE-family HTH domain
MAEKRADPYAAECGLRLRATREALGFATVRDFAAATGVTEDALSAWERGQNMVRQDYVRRLKRRFGVTFEWIFDGEASSLSVSLHDKLHRRAS